MNNCYDPETRTLYCQEIKKPRYPIAVFDASLSDQAAFQYAMMLKHFSALHGRCMELDTFGFLDSIGDNIEDVKTALADYEFDIRRGHNE